MRIDDTSIYCPHCHKHTALSVARGLDYNGVIDGYSIYFSEKGKWWMGVCNSCQNVVLVQETHDKKGAVKNFFPRPLPKPVDERIPSPIKDDFEEAIRCFSASAYRGTASLCRRVLQLICLDKGAEGKDLITQIKDLQNRGVITKEMEDWAHSVRWIGNDASHPDKNIVEIEDAEDVLNLVEQMIHILYIAPSISKAIKEKREKSKKSD